MYDNNGNVIQVGTTTFYTYDYQNRLTQSAISNGVSTTTTTYAYGPFGERVSQTTGSATTVYPNKFYSVITTGTTATSTDFVYAGSNLLATIDQPLVNGTATGTPITRYNHTDNLGSTNVTSDATMNVAQWFDYAPYGSVLASTNTGATKAARQYIGQFTDDSALSYLNARFYNSGQGQFVTQDPIFLALGDPNQVQQISQQKQNQLLLDPQSLNSYSYSENNPIVKSDPSGKFAPALAPVMYGLGKSGLASTVEFWGPPVLLGASVAALGVGAYSLYHNGNFNTYIEVNGGINGTTDLPNKTPNDPRGKIILGILGVTSLIGAGEEYFNKAAEAGNQFGGLATYTVMPHPVIATNPSSGNGAPIKKAPDRHLVGIVAAVEGVPARPQH